MKNFTLFKRQMMFVVFMLLGCMSIHAADDGLITEQITIKLDEAGTLFRKIGSAEQKKITSLKVIGEISESDLGLLRMMSRSSYNGWTINGNLRYLDLGETKLVGSLSDGVLEEEAFLNSELISLILPSGFVRIGKSAFLSCSHLERISLPSSVTFIDAGAFNGCRNLTNLVLPSNLTYIGKAAFCSCIGLTNLILPSSLTHIGRGAFDSCSNLASLTLPSGITWLEKDAFYGCNALTDVRCVIDDLKKYLENGEERFDFDCKIKYIYEGDEITQLMIPSTVSCIGDNVFQKCDKLSSIYVNWSVPAKIASSAFISAYDNCILYVPKGTLQDYRLANGWKYFNNIVEFDPTGIDKVTTSADAKELSRYSVNGQRLLAPTKGLNIVKYSDGSVKKVAVQ